MHDYFEKSIGLSNKILFIENELLNNQGKLMASSTIYKEIYNLMVRQKALNIINLSDLTFENLNPSPFVINIKPHIQFAPILKSISKTIANRYVGFLKSELMHLRGKVEARQAVSGNFSHRQIAIAYFCMGTKITKENTMKITQKHSQTHSLKILQKLFLKPNQLMNFTGNKSADKKHLNDLIAAERLMSGIKRKTIAIDLSPIITAFDKAFLEKY